MSNQSLAKVAETRTRIKFDLSSASLSQASRIVPLSQGGLKVKGSGRDAFGVGGHIFTKEMHQDALKAQNNNLSRYSNNTLSHN